MGKAKSFVLALCDKVLFTSDQPKKNKMAFVSTLSQVKLLLAASYSACVVYTKTIIHLSVSKYPPLFISTSVNNCEILRSGRTGVSSLSFRTNGPPAKYFYRPAVRDSVRMLTVFQQKLYSIFFITSPSPQRKRHFYSGEWFMTIPLTIFCSFILVILENEHKISLYLLHIPEIIRSWSNCLHTSKEY